MKPIILLATAILAVAVARPQEGGGGGGGKGGGGGGGEGGFHGLEHFEDKEIHFKAHPHYHYEYKVRDEKTHDFKDKHEERDGYKVKGTYSLLEPDGKHVRVVDYTSDKKEGFIAKVTYRKHQ